MPKPRRTSDATLVRRSQQGDRRAFSALLGRYDWRLRGLAHALLLDRAEMDVALATGYLRAWRDVVRVDPKEDVAAWLYRVTYNACIDQLRREEAAADASSASAAGGATAQKRSGIAAGLAALPAAERVAVVLVDREGFSPSSAARILGMAESALSATLESARARLTPHIPESAPASTDARAGRQVSAASAAADPAGDADDDAGEPDDQAVDPDVVGGSGGSPAPTAAPESAAGTPTTGMPATGTPVASRPAALDSTADVPLAPGSSADESAEPDGAAEEDVARASGAGVPGGPDRAAEGADAPRRGRGDAGNEVVASGEDVLSGRTADGQAAGPEPGGPPAEGAPATVGRQSPGNGSGLQESSPTMPVSGTIGPNGNGRAATAVGAAPAGADGDDHADAAPSGSGDGADAASGDESRSDASAADASRSGNGSGSTPAGSGNGSNGAKGQPKGDRGNAANRNRGKGRRARRRAQHAAGHGLAERPGSPRDDTT